MYLLRKYDIFLIASITFVSLLTILNNANIYISGAVMIFITLLLLVSKYEFSVYFLFFYLPFVYYLNGYNVGGISVYTILSMVVVLRFLYNKQRVSYMFLLILVTFTAQQIFTIFLFGQNVLNIFSLVLNIFIIYVIYNSYIEKRLDLKKSVLSLSYGLLLSIILSYFTEQSILVLEYWERYTGLWNDPNFFGFYCLMAASLLYVVIDRNLINKYFGIIMILVILYFGFQTMSRTYIFVFVLSITPYILFNFIFVKGTLKNKVSLFLLLLSGILILVLIIIPEIDSIRGIVSTNSSDWTNSRITDTIYLLNTVVSEPKSIIFGFGYDNSVSIIRQVTSSDKVSHNTYFDLLFEFGVVLFLIMSYIGIRLFRKVLLRFKIVLSVNFIPVYILLFYLLTLSMLQFDALMIICPLIGFINMKEFTYEGKQ